MDGLIGVGKLDFEMQRFVAPVSDYARSDRDGYQVFGSLAAGYEHRDKGLLVSPVRRLDYSADRLDQATEAGAGQFALTYFKQNTSSVQGALGLRADRSTLRFRLGGAAHTGGYGTNSRTSASCSSLMRT